eukprot:3032705-Pleurochrysis_carterae.AAC.1
MAGAFPVMPQGQLGRLRALHRAGRTGRKVAAAPRGCGQAREGGVFSACPGLHQGLRGGGRRRRR